MRNSKFGVTYDEIITNEGEKTHGFNREDDSLIFFHSEYAQTLELSAFSRYTKNG